MRKYLILLGIALLAGGWYFVRHRPPHELWTGDLPGIGTFSSPRVTDLNGDGVLDIVMGAGRAEFEYSDSAMIALDGKTGKLLWHNSAKDQIFGSAALYDVNGDGVKDAFFAGRDVELKALDGKTGKTIWHFDPEKYSENGKRWFNFYNPQLIHDVDGDGKRDLLIANGGDVAVPPFNPNRAAGRLVVLSSATGALLAEATMPDQKEIYMSTVVKFDAAKPGSSEVIFGTGGESTGGGLFVGTLQMVLDGDLSPAVLLATGEKRGFIAPPVWVDVNLDGRPDIVAVGVDGRVLAFDGKTHKPLWTASVPKTEAYTTVGIGQFNADPAPDFFVSFATGRYPNLTWTRQAMIDGRSGQIQFVDSLGYFQTSSPVVVDVDGDGIDEVLLSVDSQVFEEGDQVLNTHIVSIHFPTRKVMKFAGGIAGHNLASTPWIGDLDGDGYLDLIYTHSVDKHSKLAQAFTGMQVHRVATSIPIKRPLPWGAYMGSYYDGVYRSDPPGDLQ